VKHLFFFIIENIFVTLFIILQGFNPPIKEGSLFVCFVLSQIDLPTHKKVLSCVLCIVGKTLNEW
jgi:hypothetical protein